MMEKLLEVLESFIQLVNYAADVRLETKNSNANIAYVNASVSSRSIAGTSPKPSMNSSKQSRLIGAKQRL